MDKIAVGVIANPASGRDIRRLVAGASVFDNAEKGSMVLRLMAGLGATGVERVVMMPAGDGVSARLVRALEGRTGDFAERPMPALEFLDMTLRGNATDTASAVAQMLLKRVAAIAVLGGDGTHRIVAKVCGDTPLCTLSTGTNNAFPHMCEATIAGLATGLVVSGRVGPEALRREKLLWVSRNGDPRHDAAVVDVAVSGSRWVGARALWRIGDIREFLVTFASPSAVGLSAIAALLEPVPRSARHGLHVRLADPARAASVLMAPFAPGLIVPVGIAGYRRIEPGEVTRLEGGPGSLALDGERELELAAGDEVGVRLGEGPLTIDVDEVMGQAARRGLLNGACPSLRRDIHHKEAVP